MVVFRNLFVFFQFFDCVIGFAAQIADGNFGVFAFAPDNLGQFLAALLGHHWHGYADQVAHGSRVQTEITLANRFFNLGAHTLFPGLNTNRAGIDQIQVGHLAQGHHGAVVLHLHRVQQCRVGTPGAHFGQGIFEISDGLVHLAFHVAPDVCDRHTRHSKNSNMHQRAFVLTHHHTLKRAVLEN